MCKDGINHDLKSVRTGAVSRRRLPWQGAALAGLLALSLAGCKAQARSETPADAAESATEPASEKSLSMDGLRISFAEDFNDKFSVSSWGCMTDWIAHTPWHGDFGDAAFGDPGQGFPFTVANGALSIEARRFENDTWHSGMLSARDVCNSGWSQLYGYFEIRAKLPEAAGFWPVFWLIGVNPKTYGTAEIDVFERHTSTPEGFTVGIIKHPGVSDMEKRVVGTRHDVEPGLLSSQFNTYGVEIDPENTVFYFNRQEIFRAETDKEFRQPFFMLVSLAVVKSEMTDETPDSVTMDVDYLHVYQRSETQ